jgi:hypothetical protein
MAVPSGSFVADGISAWLGVMPVEGGWRSKGSFCESAEFEALSPETLGGRPQAQRRLSISRTMAMRSAGDGMNSSIMWLSGTSLVDTFQLPLFAGLSSMQILNRIKNTDVGFLEPSSGAPFH